MLTKRCVYNLKRYLDVAPVGHWHIHRACMSFVLLNGSIKAKGQSEDIASIERRHPGFCTESQAMFTRGMEALQLYENCFGEEESDFEWHYRQAASIIATMHDQGLLEGTFEKPPGVDYICAYPPCTKSSWSDERQGSTKLCARCESVSYCSKDCQCQVLSVCFRSGI